MVSFCPHVFYDNRHCLGTSLAVLSHNFRMGVSTLSNIVSETCEVIWNVLESIVIRTPNTEDEWKAVADRNFER